MTREHYQAAEDLKGYRIPVCVFKRCLAGTKNQELLGLHIWRTASM